MTERTGRRAMLRAALAVSLGVPLLELCPRLSRDVAAQGPDPRSQRPQRGDRFAVPSGERRGQPITPADLPLGGPPVSVFPLDPGSGELRDGSRLKQVLLVRFGPSECSEETRGRSAGESRRTRASVPMPVATSRSGSRSRGASGAQIFAGGTNDRYFRAFDAKTGEPVWQWRTNSGITAVPTSFAVDGVQYIAVPSGWGVDAQRMQSSLDEFRGVKTDVPQGGVIRVFALRK